MHEICSHTSRRQYNNTGEICDINYIQDYWTVTKNLKTKNRHSNRTVGPNPKLFFNVVI